jgi:hypothetical protein
MKVFDMPVLSQALTGYNRVRTNDSVHKVLMTGRIGRLGSLVKDILNSKSLTFDEYLFNNMSDTLTFKVAELDRLISEFPNVEIIEMWDDRTEHISHFEEWGRKMEIIMKDKGRPFQFIMHHVIGDHHK